MTNNGAETGRVLGEPSSDTLESMFTTDNQDSQNQDSTTLDSINTNIDSINEGSISSDSSDTIIDVISTDSTYAISTTAADSNPPCVVAQGCNPSVPMNPDFDEEKCKNDFEGYTGIKLEIKLGNSTNPITKDNVDKAKLQEYKDTLCEKIKHLFITPEQRKYITRIRIFSDFFVRKQFADQFDATAFTESDGTITMNDNILFNETYIGTDFNYFQESFMHEITHLILHKMRPHNKEGSEIDSNLDKEWKAVAGDIYGEYYAEGESGFATCRTSGGIVECMNISSEFPRGGFIYKEDESKPNKIQLAETPKYGVMRAYSASNLDEDIATFADSARYHVKDLKDALSNKNQWNKIYLEKLILLHKYKIITITNMIMF